MPETECLEIITDESKLRHISDPVSLENDSIEPIVDKLMSSLPKGASGLALCQIGECKRAFIVNLSIGQYVFINPKITWNSPDQILGLEGCLSLPNASKWIYRFRRIKVNADSIHNISGKELPFDAYDIILTESDARIFQHETDHLDGNLIIDFEEKSIQEVSLERQKKRKEKIQKKRDKKNKKNGPKTKKDSSRLKKQQAILKKKNYKIRKRLRSKVEQDEAEKIEKLELFD